MFIFIFTLCYNSLVIKRKERFKYKGDNMKRICAVLFFLFCVSAVNNLTVKAEDTVIHKASKVTFEYVLTVDGKVIDSSKNRGPLEYTQGDGKLIPGLARQLEGMKAGEEKAIEVKPEEAYGNPTPDAVAFREVPLSSLPKGTKPVVGMALQGAGKDGRAFPARIVEVKKNTIIIDLNHPLAGKTLLFNIKIISVK